jgi:hypothetical protein
VAFVFPCRKDVTMPSGTTLKVFLTDDQRVFLERIVGTGSHPVRMVARARILLDADESGGSGSGSRADR